MCWPLLKVKCNLLVSWSGDREQYIRNNTGHLWNAFLNLMSDRLKLRNTKYYGFSIDLFFQFSLEVC